MLIADEITAYAVAHTSEVPDIYERLREETYADLEDPQMQVGPLEGRFLKLLVQILAPRLAVEVGTFTGYSGLSIAEGLPEGGRLITFDRDPLAAAVARRYFAEADWGDKIELVEGPALPALEAIGGSIDFAFIDADKQNYINYWEQIVAVMPPGGVIIVDNTLWGGTVLDPRIDSARAVAAFNRHAAADERVEQVLLTVRDGLLMARRK